MDQHSFVNGGDEIQPFTTFENKNHFLIEVATKQNYLIKKPHDSRSLGIPVLPVKYLREIYI